MGNKSEHVKQVLRARLLAQVSSLVDDRVFGAHVRDADAGTLAKPFLVVDVRGGDALAGNNQVQSVIFDLWAYGEAGEVSNLYDAAYEALHGEELGETVTVNGGDVQIRGLCYEIARPLDGYNDKIQAYYSRGRFAFSTAG